MFPKLMRNKHNEEAIKNLYEYLDITKIIKRLQDIDKMKIILFDEKQRKVFEEIPKPGITGYSKKKTMFLTVEAIKREKKFADLHNSIKDLQVDNVSKYDNNMNKRLIGLVQPKLKMIETFKSRKNTG